MKYAKFQTLPFSSIWLKISLNWHIAKRQGPKKKCSCFSRGMIYPCPAYKACNLGSFTSYRGSGLGFMSRYCRYNFVGMLSFGNLYMPFTINQCKLLLIQRCILTSRMGQVHIECKYWNTFFSVNVSKCSLEQMEFFKILSSEKKWNRTILVKLCCRAPDIIWRSKSNTTITVMYSSVFIK